MAANPNQDPFGGNGVYINGGWIPKDNQEAINKATAQAGGSIQQSSQPATPPPPSGPITNAGQVTSGTATVGQTTAPGQPTSIAQSFQQGLINRLNPQAVSASNPAIQPAIAANNLAEQRAFERNRNLLAERNAVNNGGVTSGAFDTQLLGLSQDRAAREGQFAGNAVQQLSDQQSRDQNTALGMAGSLLSGQQQLAQAAQLANLDATLRQAALDQQGSLGQGDLALRSRLGEGNLNLGLLSLLTQNDQFGRSLAQNASQFGASLDQSGLLGLLGLL